jgi:hypothetical protein
MKPIKLLLGYLVAATLLGGCAAKQTEKQTAPQLNEHQHQLPNGDLQETTAGLTTLPTFLNNLDPQIKHSYEVASQHLDLLTWIPCYCGCGKSAGHKNNANCFIKEVKQDGSVVWDDHGTRCSTCMNIAVTSAKLKGQGKSIKEIRSIIDNQYKEGYAQPTPTPMPN